MSVGEICNRDVVITDRTTTIMEAAQLMRQYHVGNVVVVEDKGDQNVPVGILTDRDIVLEVLAKTVALDTVTVGDVMSSDLITAREQDGVWETIKLMRSRGIRRLPVVNDQGGLEGILAVDDLLELLAEEIADLARVVSREQLREKEKRK